MGERDRKKPQKMPWLSDPVLQAEYTVIVDDAAPPTARSVTIYGLVDPTEPIHIRYVWQTVNPKARYTNHRNGQRSPRKLREWTEMLRWERRVLRMVELEYLPAEEPAVWNLAFNREAAWILALREIGQADLNEQIPHMWNDIALGRTA